MINPTQEDIGRRVRWIGQNPFGRLVSIDGDTATVRFDYEVMPRQGCDLNALNWAADNIGKMQTGKKEPTRHPRKAFRNNPPGRWDDR